MRAGRTKTALAVALGLSGTALLAGAPAMAGVSGSVPARATSYIARDTGAATENPDVNIPSNCGRPDVADIQRMSAPGSTARNVHNDACLFSAAAPSTATRSDVDVPATFESFGVGYISACPDPDLTGPKTATTHDHSGDGFADHCHQSGVQSRPGAAGNDEYHARLNNFTAPGQQRVLFCYDPDGDGCLDESVRSQIAIGWTPA